jgi:CubicO group peptidase (beta-lactamase class C family)
VRQLRALSISLALATYVVATGAVTIHQYSAVNAATDETVAEHIRAVENGLVPPAATGREQKWNLQERMAFYKVPAVSIAVINNYEIKWAKAWGVTESGGAIAATPDTLFQAAQISESVGAMAVIHLIERGKLNLDANVDDYLKSWKVPENDFTRVKAVTLRELLSHSAPTTIVGFSGYNVRVGRPGLSQILRGVPPANNPAVEVAGIPGSRWQYSGGGFEVIQQVLEDLSGEPFPQLMQTTVFAPLGMTHSYYAQPLPSSLETAAAVGTFADGLEVPGKWHVYPELMAAGLWTTPSDLARFAIALMKAERGESNPVVSAEGIAQMLHPQLSTDAPEFSQSGLGIFVHGIGDGARFFSWRL